MDGAAAPPVPCAVHDDVATDRSGVADDEGRDGRVMEGHDVAAESCHRVAEAKAVRPWEVKDGVVGDLHMYAAQECTRAGVGGGEQGGLRGEVARDAGAADDLEAEPLELLGCFCGRRCLIGVEQQLRGPMEVVTVGPAHSVTWSSLVSPHRRRTQLRHPASPR